KMALNRAMNKRLIPVLVLLAFSSTCLGQSVVPASVVQVLVLDYKTGLPVRGREVEMILPDSNGDLYNRSPQISEKTGKNGIAVFHLSSPLPSQFWVVTDAMADFPCTRRQSFETSEVLQRGIIGDHADFELCKNPTSRRALVQPGEIVLYVRRLNPWLRFRRVVWEVFQG
ncbi:MAG TPA: hypothetical protein VFP71_02020, partial [Candidatus Angelobacter sp.]|nr:hypothetical protein [Candidatus Angelobacter sp.]